MFQMAPDTDVTVAQDGDVIELAVNNGAIAFASASRLRISLKPYEFEPAQAAAGKVGLAGSKTVAVLSTKGSMLVRNTSTKESFVLMEGQEKRMGRYNGVVADPLTMIASNFPSLPPGVPTPMPTPAPQAGGMSSGAWVAIIAAVAGGAAAGSWFLARRDQVDESELTAANASLADANSRVSNLNSQISTLNSSIADKNTEIAGLNTQITSLGNTNAALTGQLVDVQNAATAELGAALARLRAIEIELGAEQTKNAVAASSLTDAEKAAFTAEGDAIVTEITAAKAELAAVETELAGIADQLAALGISTSGSPLSSAEATALAGNDQTTLGAISGVPAGGFEVGPHFIDAADLNAKLDLYPNSLRDVVAQLYVQGDAATHKGNAARNRLNNAQDDYNDWNTRVKGSGVDTGDAGTFAKLDDPVFKVQPEVPSPS